MPGGDGTGPQGRGPLTGRGLGPCGTANYQTPLNRQNLNWGQRLLSGITKPFRIGRGGGVWAGEADWDVKVDKEETDNKTESIK